MNTDTFLAGTAIGGKELRSTVVSNAAPSNRYFVARLRSGTWTSATLSLKASPDGVTFYPIKVAGSYIGITPSLLHYDAFLIPTNFPYLQLWSTDGSGADTNQVNAIVVEYFFTN